MLTLNNFSSLLSQVAMTLGGSLFPGALGAMLIEVLPFMRGVASDIQNALGDDSPSVVPTVMVAYALSSFLIGIIFIIIGGLGLGRLVSRPLQHTTFNHYSLALIVSSRCPIFPRQSSLVQLGASAFLSSFWALNCHYLQTKPLLCPTQAGFYSATVI